MKKLKTFSLILTFCLFICSLMVPTLAVEYHSIETEHIEIYIENPNISDETKAKIIAYYTNEKEHNNDSTTYGLTCTLLGHKLESSVVTTITHKARTTSPRCLQKKYLYESCTRCDYEDSTLSSSVYIVCC